MTLDPQAAAVLAMLAEAGMTEFPAYQPAPQVRAMFDAQKPPPEALPPIHSVEDTKIPGPAGDIGVRIYRPSDDTELPVLLWLHGGGWVIGDLDSGDFPCRRIAVGANCVVASIDYRLAPESPFPAAVEDSDAAAAWALAELAGGDPSRLAVGGDSAGGNLAAVVARHQRDAGNQLAGQVLVYPVTDADFSTGSYVENAKGYLLDTPAMQWFWDCYVPDVNQRTDPDAAPLHAEDLSGLAPAWIVSAGYDPLRDEVVAFAEAMESAGVDVASSSFPGQIHGFFTSNLVIDDAAVAQDDAAAWLAAAFSR